MLSEEMQEILAVPDPDLDKFDPGNAVRRSTRAIKAPKPFAAVPLSPPANKRQKRQQEPKGLQSPPVTLANNTVQTAGTAKGYNSLKSQSKSEQRAQDDDGDVEMNDEDEMESDAGDEFNPENKKRPRASLGRRGLDMPVQVTVAADTNVEGVVSKNAPDIGPDALIEANLFAVLRGNTGVLAPEPIQSSTDGRTTGNTSSAQTVAAVPTGALATGLTTQRPNSDEEANLDAKLSVGLQPQRTDKERPLSQGEPLVWAEVSL